MSLIVFAGPTIEAAVVRSFGDAAVLGPVSFGDVYRAGKERPRAILIIDGYFDRVPAVWHKEILWAMSEGIHVFGCSSMGALRAAELSDLFGMVGIGAIFEAYRSGQLEDDDEVAVAHGRVEDGYVPTSEALVNVRATLASALERGVISPETCRLLLSVGKATFYAERSYAGILRGAEAQGARSEELAALRAWLPANKVDQKRADALMALRQISDWLTNPREPKRVEFNFHATDAWCQATRMADAAGVERTTSNQQVAALLEELKIDGSYRAAWQASALRGLAIREANRAGFSPDLVAVRGAFEQLQDRSGCESATLFKDWTVQQGLTEGEALRFLEEEARVAWSTPVLDDLVRGQLVAHLREAGSYTRLLAKIDAKRKHFEAFGFVTPALAKVVRSELELWQWYFGTRLGRDIPTDLQRFARNSGFRNVDELRSAVVRECSFTARQVSVD